MGDRTACVVCGEGGVCRCVRKGVASGSSVVDTTSGEIGTWTVYDGRSAGRTVPGIVGVTAKFTRVLLGGGRGVVGYECRVRRSSIKGVGCCTSVVRSIRWEVCTCSVHECRETVVIHTVPCVVRGTVKFTRICFGCIVVHWIECCTEGCIRDLVRRRSAVEGCIARWESATVTSYWLSYTRSGCITPSIPRITVKSTRILDNITRRICTCEGCSRRSIHEVVVRRVTVVMGIIRSSLTCSGDEILDTLRSIPVVPVATVKFTGVLRNRTRYIATREGCSSGSIIEAIVRCPVVEYTIRCQSLTVAGDGCEYARRGRTVHHIPIRTAIVTRCRRWCCIVIKCRGRTDDTEVGVGSRVVVVDGIEGDACARTVKRRILRITHPCVRVPFIPGSVTRELTRILGGGACVARIERCAIGSITECVANSSTVVGSIGWEVRSSRSGVLTCSVYVYRLA